MRQTGRVLECGVLEGDERQYVQRADARMHAGMSTQVDPFSATAGQRERRVDNLRAVPHDCEHAAMVH